MGDTPAFLRLVAHSGTFKLGYSAQVPELVLHVTMAYTPELARLEFGSSIDVNLEGLRYNCFVWLVEPAPNAVATSYHFFTLDGKPYDPLAAVQRRLDSFKVSVAFVTKFMEQQKSPTRGRASE